MKLQHVLKLLDLIDIEGDSDFALKMRTHPLTHVLFYDTVGKLFFYRKVIMSRTCDICGKHTITGNKVSHAKNHTRRTWRPNLVKIKTEVGGTTVTLKICARCLRSDYISRKV
jgi:large subunit ribosomal protein L28